MTDERKDRPPLTGGGPRPGASSPAGGTPARPDPKSEKQPKDGGEAAPKGAEPKRKDEGGPQFVGTGVFWGLVVGILLAVVVIVFASQNTQSATVKAFAWEWSSPLFVVILISLILGIVLDEIVGLLYRSRKRRRLAEREELKRLRGKH